MPKKKTKSKKSETKAKKTGIKTKEEKTEIKPLAEETSTISKKEQIKNQNKILRNFFIIIGIIALIIIVAAFWVISERSFDYHGMEFEVVKFCDAKPCLIMYNTKIPVTYEGKPANYNFYLRNDPRNLEKNIPFEGNLELRDDLVIDITFDNYCDGYETIAIANLVNLIDISGINKRTEQGATCDSTGNEMYIMIQESDRTYIEQVGPACYDINIKDCEILKGTERFMIEMFVELMK